MPSYLECLVSFGLGFKEVFGEDPVDVRERHALCDARFDTCSWIEERSSGVNVAHERDVETAMLGTTGCRQVVVIIYSQVESLYVASLRRRHVGG